jgi:ribonuclease E
LSILRIIEEEAMKESTQRILAQLPLSVATFLLNEKRRAIQAIEERQDVEVIILPHEHLETPDYHIERIRTQDLGKLPKEQLSHEMIEALEAEAPSQVRPAESGRMEQPAVKHIFHTVPAPHRFEEPERTDRASESLLKRIWTSLFTHRPEGVEEVLSGAREWARGSGEQGKTGGPPQGAGPAGRGERRAETGRKPVPGERPAVSRHEPALTRPEGPQRGPGASRPEGDRQRSAERGPRRGERGGRSARRGDSRREENRRPPTQAASPTAEPPGSDTLSTVGEEAPKPMPASPITAQGPAESPSSRSGGKAFDAAGRGSTGPGAPEGPTTLAPPAPAPNTSKTGPTSELEAPPATAGPREAAAGAPGTPTSGEGAPKARSGRRRRGGRGRRRGAGTGEDKTPASAKTGDGSAGTSQGAEAASDAGEPRPPDKSPTAGTAKAGERRPDQAGAPLPDNASERQHAAARSDANPDSRPPRSQPEPNGKDAPSSNSAPSGSPGSAVDSQQQARSRADRDVSTADAPEALDPSARQAAE